MISVQEGVTTEKTSPVKESRRELKMNWNLKAQAALTFPKEFFSCYFCWQCVVNSNEQKTNFSEVSVNAKPTPVKIPLHNCDFLVDKSSELTSLIDLLWVYGVKVKVGHFLYTSFEGKTIWKRTKQNDFSAYYSWGHFSYSAKEKGDKRETINLANVPTYFSFHCF